MDFVKLLNNSIDQKDNKNRDNKDNKNRDKKDNQCDNKKDNQYERRPEHIRVLKDDYTVRTTQSQSHSHLHIYSNIQVGDFVKIVRLENSQYNDYKGYMGEVKEYKKGKDYATVMITSTNVPKFIKIPLEHFIKM